MKKITSATNPYIKQIVSLRDRSKRNKLNRSFAEGKREVAQLLKSKQMVKEVFISEHAIKLLDEIITACKAKNIDVFCVTESVFNKISYGDRDEGVLALFEPVTFNISQLPQRKNALYLIVEKVEKPGNLGAILRSSDGAGVDAVIVCDGRTDIYNPNVVRASLGTVFSNTVIVSTLDETLKILKKQGVKICAATPNAKSVYTSVNLNQSIALLVGSEKDGLTDNWLKHSDLKVKIPMKGQADSLNVSASTAILLYETLRQRS